MMFLIQSSFLVKKFRNVSLPSIFESKHKILQEISKIILESKGTVYAAFVLSSPGDENLLMLTKR